MHEASKRLTYKRRGSVGALTMNGIIDAFEARELHAAAVRATADAHTQTVKVDVCGVERLDITASQVLIALRTALKANGKTLEITAPPEGVTRFLALSGWEQPS